MDESMEESMKKLRAVSPVVAILLLIIVAVAAVLLIYLWMTGFVGKATRTPTEMKTEFKIEAVGIYNASKYFDKTDFKKGNATVIIYVRNTGATSLDLSAIKEKNSLAVYLYDSSTGELVYRNTTLTAGMESVPDTSIDKNDITNSIAIYDNNRNGVWEPGELLIIEFYHLNTTKVPEGALGLGSAILKCGHYYDVRIVINGIEDVFTYARVVCK